MPKHSHNLLSSRCLLLGFRRVCPPEIQAVIIRYLDNWKDNLPLVSIIWDPEENAHILIEISRQAYSMPVSFHNSIMLAIHIYKSWLLDTGKNKMFQEKLLQEYWQVILCM